ncbi:MAG: hypothetical protein AAF202_12575, partial [Pseudomonadota bacterium]
ICDVIALLEPITMLYESEKNIQAQKVLLLDGTKKQQILAKMALGTTGAELKVARNNEEAEEAFHGSQYDIIYLDESMLDLAAQIQNRSPATNMVIMTSEDIPAAIQKLQKLPKMPNVVSRSLVNRSFTMKNIGTSLSKLASKDIFGLEKYLSWGSEIKEICVKRSDEREKYNETVMEYLGQLGVRSSHRSRVSQVLEEMLMNAIYDAPLDEAGNQMYNHLERTKVVELGPEHEATLRYGSDGIMMAVAMEDPNGSLQGKTILNYLESCYSGNAGELQQNKGGAGRGLHMIIETSDLVVFNLRPNHRTEVIALFHVDPKSVQDQDPTFHFFVQ